MPPGRPPYAPLSSRGIRGKNRASSRAARPGWRRERRPAGPDSPERGRSMGCSAPHRPAQAGGNPGRKPAQRERDNKEMSYENAVCPVPGSALPAVLRLELTHGNGCAECFRPPPHGAVGHFWPHAAAPAGAVAGPREPLPLVRQGCAAGPAVGAAADHVRLSVTDERGFPP